MYAIISARMVFLNLPRIRGTWWARHERPTKLVQLGKQSKSTRKRNTPEIDPQIVLSLLFNFLAFLLCKDFLAFLSMSLLSQGFGGSPVKKNPCFFGSFPCLLLKKQGKEDQGYSQYQCFLMCCVFECVFGAPLEENREHSKRQHT